MRRENAYLPKMRIEGKTEFISQLTQISRQMANTIRLEFTQGERLCFSQHTNKTHVLGLGRLGAHVPKTRDDTTANFVNLNILSLFFMLVSVHYKIS